MANDDDEGLDGIETEAITGSDESDDADALLGIDTEEVTRSAPDDEEGRER